jgi:hypothetical protein
MTTIIDPLTASSMSDITVNSWTTFFVIFLILLMSIFIVVWLYFIGRRGTKKIDPQEKRYEELYQIIQFLLSFNEVCENNYFYILSKIDELGALPYKNVEMTDILSNTFKEKYKSVRDEIDSREEFAPGQVFKK